jgi:hypothetical protein
VGAEVIDESKEARRDRLFGDADEDLKRKWRQFHMTNPHVYQLFKRFSTEAKNAGRQASYVGHKPYSSAL